MTANKRIAINVIATYGRSLYSLFLGLFTSRWALSALGEVNYGLLCLVGGLSGFVVFLNTLLSSATSRYFAFTIGRTQIPGNYESALTECREWFSTAFFIHLILAALLVGLGYPLGRWAINEFLSIPVDRIHACQIVWVTVIVSCFVNMINVPFQAMYNAKQEIAEMTMYNVITATANAIFIFYTVRNPSDWLIPYAIWGAILSLVPLLIMSVRAFILYPECKIVSSALVRVDKLKEMFCYSLAQFVADFASMISGQGISVAINKFLGVSYNAAAGISQKVTDQVQSLGTAMMGALNPVIANSAGANQLDRMRYFSLLSCKYGSFFVMIFAIPLLLEVDEVMHLWLQSPPNGATILCVLAMITFVVDRLTAGLSSAIEALGKIAAFKVSMGMAGLLPFLFCLIILSNGFGVAGVGLGILLSKLPFAAIRLYYARKLAGMSISIWLKKVFVPCAAISGLSILAGLVSRNNLPQSCVRVIITSVTVEFVLFPMAWYVLLDNSEREYIIAKLKSYRLRK